MSKKEIYQFTHNGEIVQELDMSDWQCSGISGRLPINEACGGCVGCILAQATYNSEIEFERTETEEAIIYRTKE